jgi:hypothetical protein
MLPVADDRPGPSLTEHLASYFDAWNEVAPDVRRTLLDRCLVPDVQVIHPTWGQLTGIDDLDGRIQVLQQVMPGLRVVLTSGIDVHHGIARYEWAVIDSNGTPVLEGLDIAEHAEDGRLRRVILFHGPLPPAG